MKHNLKKGLALLLMTALILGIAACGKVVAPGTSTQVETPKEKTKIKVAALKGPTGMGMVELMQSHEAGDAGLDYEFTLVGSPDDLVGKIISGEVDVAAVPTNLALVLHNRTEGAVQLAAVNTLGVLYMIENGDTVHSMNDLKGKTVYTSGKGASPDYIFQYILQKNQLTADKDVMLDYKLQHAELAAALAAGDVNLGLLPQPHVTTALMKNQNLRIALDITEEWTKVVENQGKLAMGAIIVQKEFAENHQEAFNVFLEEYKKSVDFVNTHADEAAVLIEKYEILPNAAIAKKAIPYSNIVYIDAQEAKPFLQDFYQILFNFDPKSIGGKLADEGFYYKK